MFFTELRFRKQAGPWPSRRLMSVATTLLALVLIVAVVAVVSSSRSPAGQGRAAASALDAGDLLELESILVANQGDPQFAFELAKELTPRRIGDGLGEVAREDGERPFRPGVRPHQYALVLTHLAGALSLATHGEGDLALPRYWVADYITASTEPAILYGESDGYFDFDGKRREKQDTANRAALLLLLSRGSWSPQFLRQATRAFYDIETEAGGDAWPRAEPDEARYAPSPGGAYLTDGVLALMTALTAAPQTSAWAFNDFLPGTMDIEGTGVRVGRFTHFLLFEHAFPQDGDGVVIGSTSVLTALSSAIEGEGSAAADPGPRGRTRPKAGPRRDSIVLQALAGLAAEDSDCTLSPATYPECVVDAVSAVFRWVRRWGHAVLAVLTFAGRYAPPPLGVGVTVGSAAVNATWHVVEGDLSAAGLSLAAVMKRLPFAAIRRTAPAVQVSARAAGAPADVAQLREIAATAQAWELPRP